MRSPLRIDFVALCFPPDVGGSELYNGECARRLHARGHAVRVFTWGRGNAAERTADAALPFEVHRQPLRLRGGAIDPRGLPDWLDAVAPDVVYVSRGSKILRRVVPVAARRAPLVLSIHDLGGRFTRRGPFARWRLRRRYGLDHARRVVASSEDTRSRVAASGVEAPISIVYPGTDTKAFAPDPLMRERARRKLDLEGRQVLLTVARLAANKRHVRVLEALPRLRHRFPRLTYLVVGEGERRAALASRAGELGVADIVRFTGRVDDTRLFYAASDVFVMPSGRSSASKAGEGFGIAYVEAGACGVPVVASRSGGGAEIVVDGETGRTVDPDDPRALEEALVELLADSGRARRLGEAARLRCQGFDWERSVDALIAILRCAAAGS